MEDLYDEFGNYIGDVDTSEEESLDERINSSAQGQELGSKEAEQPIDQTESDFSHGIHDTAPSDTVVLHEDKRYYPTPQQTYGHDVETLVEEEDTQSLNVPIIAPIKTKKFTVQAEELPEVSFSREFMMDLFNYPEQNRNIALVGHLHHGKTSFMDILFAQTHDSFGHQSANARNLRDESIRFTDIHRLERHRGLSIKSSPTSLLLQGTKGKSHVVNIIDTPGHVDFVDEVAASLRLVDGVVLVVDVIEGVQANTERIIQYAVSEDLPLTLVINKMDRLILELKLPPTDSYFKLKHVVEEINTVISKAAPGKGAEKRVSPERGNVAFASSKLNWCFTIQSFAKRYCESYPSLDSSEFAARLWGDIFYDPERRKFTRKGSAGLMRSFVVFILEPVYKLFSLTISQKPQDLKKTLATLGVVLKPNQLKSDAKVLLKFVCAQFLGHMGGFVDMVLDHIPSPVHAASRILHKYYTGPMDSNTAASMASCNQDGPLVVHVTKLLSTADGSGFYAFGRVMSGTAVPGKQLRVLGESYSVEDEEDMAVATVSNTWVCETQYNILTSGVPAGNFVLLGGVDNSISKTATLVDMKLPNEEDAHVFRPIKHMTESVFKIAVEPINPSELPKMLEGLRKINKSYPLITTKVEESGEHIILGTGELYMDCVLHDLRRVYADMELKVSDPVTRFCETVTETSAIMCYSVTPNKKNKITMIAEPLDDGIAADIENGNVRINDPIRTVGQFFEKHYDWDKLAARSIWAFGPEEMGPNILQDDTLPSQIDKKLLASVRDSIRQGFNWGTREGPLCEEPIRNAKFRLTDISLADQAIFRGGGQIIPTTRRAIYSSFLMASPRLMEPIFSCFVTGPADSITATYTILSRRRGHVIVDGPVAGTPLYSVQGLLPVIDSFGFETDLRIHTQGQAMVSLVFDKWSVVPGDPLDREAKTRPLEVASAMETARDFVLKTRRRKGLVEDITVSKFLELDLWRELKESGLLGTG